ncbi:MAG: hypothetical protein N2V75_03240 [Methanophagales archaeon]|nr:hypothetical protein [Methanophagales archaeon]
MKSIKVDTDMGVKQKLLWCFFWTNRKAIRTEGCAPFLIKEIITSGVIYSPEPGKILKLSNDIFKSIEKDMKAGKIVRFKIEIGNENFDISFQKNVFSVSTKRNKEIEEEIVESLNDDLERGKPKICSAFPQRVGIDVQI